MLHRRRAVAVLGALLALVGTLVTTPSAGAATTGSASPASPTRTSWSSGAFTGHSATIATQLGLWRGRPLDNLSVFPSRDSWAAMTNPWFLSSGTVPVGFTGDLTVAVPLWPQNSSVNADADAQWRSFARLVAAKDPDAYIRLGWEMNIGQYWRVTAQNRTQWIAAFTRAAVAMKSVAPALRIVWNPNWGGDQSGTDSRAVFQAVKAQVSVYGIDYYDSWPPDTSAANWNVRLNGPRALADSLAYARANGKLFALPEWGVACTTAGCQWQGHAGGDNPRYVTDLLGYLRAHAADIAFESYFNEPAGYLGSSLRAGTNTRAAAAYLAMLGPSAR